MQCQICIFNSIKHHDFQCEIHHTSFSITNSCRDILLLIKWLDRKMDRQTGQATLASLSFLIKQLPVLLVFLHCTVLT